MNLRLWWTLALAILSSVGHSAASFETSYLKIDLPEAWTCDQMETDWACRPTSKDLIHTATLIFSAKEAAPEDSLAMLETQLKAPRTISTASGRGTVTSKVVWIRPVELGGTRWVEALHANRELDGYFTYYLATVTPRLTVLLNFTFQQTHAKLHQPLLEGMRRSVKLKKSVLEGNTLKPAPHPVATTLTEPADTKRSQYLLGLGLFGVGTAIYFAMRRKRR